MDGPGSSTCVARPGRRGCTLSWGARRAFLKAAARLMKRAKRAGGTRGPRFASYKPTLVRHNLAVGSPGHRQNGRRGYLGPGGSLFTRVRCQPDPLRIASRLMVDKTTTVTRTRLRTRVGRLDHDDAVRLSQGILVFLGVAASPRVGAGS